MLESMESQRVRHDLKTELTEYFRSSLVEFLKFSIWKIISVKVGIFPSFTNGDVLFLIAMAWTVLIVLNNSNKSAYPCLVPHIKRNMFNVSSLAMMFSLDNSYQIEGTSLVAQRVKNLPVMRETGFDPWVGKISWRRQGQPTPVFWPGKFHGQMSMAGYSPWGS